MLVTRWQAAVLPSIEQLTLMFENEGLLCHKEVVEQNTEIKDHRHPFDEIRVVVAGSLFFNIAGNQLLLRPGDRIEIPANTRHSKSNQENEPCECLVAQRVS